MTPSIHDGWTPQPQVEEQVPSSETPRSDALASPLTTWRELSMGSTLLLVDVNVARQLERELIEANVMIAEADEDCARHNLYTVEEAMRAARAIAESNGKDPKTHFASWRDRIWWLEAQKEIARLRGLLGEAAS